MFEALHAFRVDFSEEWHIIRSRAEELNLYLPWWWVGVAGLDHCIMELTAQCIS